MGADENAWQTANGPVLPKGTTGKPFPWRNRLDSPDSRRNLRNATADTYRTFRPAALGGHSRGVRGRGDVESGRERRTPVGPNRKPVQCTRVHAGVGRQDGLGAGGFSRAGPVRPRPVGPDNNALGFGPRQAPRYKPAGTRCAAADAHAVVRADRSAHAAHTAPSSQSRSSHHTCGLADPQWTTSGEADAITAIRRWHAVADS